MSINERRTSATPQEVWDVLADGWTFVAWVVGASRVRAVSEDWPAVGSKVHHSVGGWPAVIDDDTEVLEVEPGRRLLLQAKLRPVGRAHVEIEVEPAGTGSLLRISEEFVSGPVRLAPKPAREVSLKIRNAETLHRLALLAERRTRP